MKTDAKHHNITVYFRDLYKMAWRLRSQIIDMADDNCIYVRLLEYYGFRRYNSFWHMIQVTKPSSDTPDAIWTVAVHPKMQKLMQENLECTGYEFCTAMRKTLGYTHNRFMYASPF